MNRYRYPAINFLSDNWYPTVPTNNLKNLTGNVRENQRGPLAYLTYAHTLVITGQYSWTQGPWVVLGPNSCRDFEFFSSKAEYEYRLGQQVGAPLWFSPTMPLNHTAQQIYCTVSLQTSLEVLFNRHNWCMLEHSSQLSDFRRCYRSSCLVLALPLDQILSPPPPTKYCPHPNRGPSLR